MISYAAVRTMEYKLTYPAELPVSEHRAEIMDAVRRNSVVIVCGDTGSGKTTQIPKMLLELGRGKGDRRIAVTQPRRLAAVTMAERVASELGGNAGQVVGYRHRYGKCLTDETKVEFMTDGVLLAETRGDPLLRRYDTIVVDEAHERSLNVDFLLGILKRILERRRDLRVVVASATMDTAKFAAFFNAPVINVPGRLFPIEICYRPPEDDDDADLPHAIASALAEINPRHDVLVFLAGERDIRETADFLAAAYGDADDIIPLIASLPASEQRRAFQTSSRRRIILATNVAETSVTIPGIRAVIDAGVARISRYVHSTQVQRLQIESISQASARQRAGRCGRLGPGTCIRLYSEEDFLKRDEYTAPEVLRSSLAGVILTMLDLKLGDIESFPFVDPPRPGMVHEGLKELLELGAIRRAKSGGAELTENGRKLARIPLEPRLARMLLAASDNAVLPEVLPIVASMACDDPLRRPIDEREKATQAHAKWRVQGSDFLGTLALWNWWKKAQEELSQSKLRKLAKANYLSYPKLREWTELTRQLERLCSRMKLSFAEIPPGETRDAAIHMSLLTGLLGRLGHYHTEDREYRGAHALRFALHPGSVLAKGPDRRRPPEWIVAGELVDTARLFAREAAVIDPRWIEPIAGEICKHHVHSPEWDAQSGFVRGTEQVTLYGLTIVESRRCNYDRFDPEAAREIFLRHGILGGEFPHPTPIIRETLDFLRTLRIRSEKTRRPEIFNEDLLLAHFVAALPEPVTNAPALKRYLARATPQELERFRLKRADWWPDESADIRDFPDSLRVGDVKLRLVYHNSPDDPEHDGLTCSLRRSEGAALSLWHDDWLVPGMLREKVTVLILSLPNSLQRLLKPLDEAIDILMSLLKQNEESLETAIRNAVYERWAFRIPEDAWKRARLPSHLRVRFVVKDDRTGKTLADTRDKAAAMAACGITGERNSVRPRQEKSVSIGADSSGPFWPFGTVVECAESGSAGMRMRHYPALTVEQDTVSLRLYAKQKAARRAHEEATVKLLAAALRNQVPFSIRARLPFEVALFLKDHNYAEPTLREDIREGAVKSILVAGRSPVRTEKDFDARLAENPAELLRAEAEIYQLFVNTAREIGRLTAAIESGRYPEATAEAVFEQLAWLCTRGTPRTVPLEILRRFPRYLKGIDIRLERARVSPTSDRTKEARFAPYWQRYREALQARDQYPPETLHRYRWLLEEFRLQTFAPELKTFETVSPKRLDEVLA